MSYIPDGAVRHHQWQSEAGVSAMISPDGSRRVIWAIILAAARRRSKWIR